MFKQEGYDLIGAAFEVYNVLGYGMAEEVYQQSLEIELGLRNIPFQSKSDIEVHYKDQTLTTVYRPDLLVFGEIIAELKAVKTLAPEHEAQLFNYMRISKKKVGYLINFGVAKEWNGSDSCSEKISVD
jgi:GxxExxY protein